MECWMTKALSSIDWITGRWHPLVPFWSDIRLIFLDTYNFFEKHIVHLACLVVYMLRVMVFYLMLQISVYPQEVQPEDPNCYRARKRDYFKLRREREKVIKALKAARKKGLAAPPELVSVLEEITAAAKARLKGKPPPKLVLASANESSESNAIAV